MCRIQLCYVIMFTLDGYSMITLKQLVWVKSLAIDQSLGWYSWIWKAQGTQSYSPMYDACMMPNVWWCWVRVYQTISGWNICFSISNILVLLHHLQLNWLNWLLQLTLIQFCQVLVCGFCITIIMFFSIVMLISIQLMASRVESFSCRRTLINAVNENHLPFAKSHIKVSFFSIFKLLVHTDGWLDDLA